MKELIKDYHHEQVNYHRECYTKRSSGLLPLSSAETKKTIPAPNCPPPSLCHPSPTITLMPQPQPIPPSLWCPSTSLSHHHCAVPACPHHHSDAPAPACPTITLMSQPQPVPIITLLSQPVPTIALMSQSQLVSHHHFDVPASSCPHHTLMSQSNIPAVQHVPYIARHLTTCFKMMQKRINTRQFCNDSCFWDKVSAVNEIQTGKLTQDCEICGWNCFSQNTIWFLFIAFFSFLIWYFTILFKGEVFAGDWRLWRHSHCH